jgi:hypothetical protein
MRRDPAAGVHSERPDPARRLQKGRPMSIFDKNLARALSFASLLVAAACGGSAEPAMETTTHTQSQTTDESGTQTTTESKDSETVQPDGSSQTESTDSTKTETPAPAPQE